jgi:calcineurin-like phosphoesterase family protein
MVAAATTDISPDQSDWREAPLRVDQTIFAIGDVHGCYDQLGLLLDTFAALAADRAARLIFLGDLICRGPSSLAALSLWAAFGLEQRFAHVHRLSGNHEQLLMLSIGGGCLAQAAYNKWMTIDGGTFVNELRRATGQRDAALTRDLLREAAGSEVLARLDHLEHNVRIGNTIFVHGGLDPSVDPATALAAPYTAFGGNHWAWIQEPFLAWRDGFGGSMVIHGHTPPAKHRALSGYPDPHVFQHDRLSLDGGSAVTGIVAGAQIENGRYRLFRARAQRA